MKLYVYCLAETIEVLTAPTVGISGARVNLIRVEDFSLLVSEFEGDSAPPVTRDNVLAHAAVVNSVFRETTPLPFRFGTIVNEDWLRSYVTSHKEALEAKLAEVHGCVEMSVKIIWNTDQGEFTESADAEGPGARFLKQKRSEILGSERRTEEAKQVAVWLNDLLATYIEQEEVRLCPTEKLIVAAAHLVSRDDVTDYRDRLAEARKTRPQLHFLVSGPWPPYTFSKIGLEVKTRFGVS
jgi:hypothetical protein